MFYQCFACPSFEVWYKLLQVFTSQVSQVFAIAKVIVFSTLLQGFTIGNLLIIGYETGLLIQAGFRLNFFRYPAPRVAGAGFDTVQ